MDYKELNQILANLDQAMVTLEETYVENEGEVTEETEQMEAQISGLQELLTTDGIDLLGGWLKSKEDRKKALKAEKDYITRQMAAIDETIEFIKAKVNQILVATGQEKVKGARGYSFAATTSTKSERNSGRQAEMRLNTLRRPPLPPCVSPNPVQARRHNDGTHRERHLDSVGDLAGQVPHLEREDPPHGD